MRKDKSVKSKGSISSEAESECCWSSTKSTSGMEYRMAVMFNGGAVVGSGNLDVFLTGTLNCNGPEDNVEFEIDDRDKEEFRKEIKRE